MSRRVVALVVAGSLASCTIGLPLTTSGVIATHNVAVDHADDKWGYATAVYVTAAIGAAVDALFLYALARAWSHPMT